MMLSARPNQGVSGLEDFRDGRQRGSIGQTWVKSGTRHEALASSPDELRSADDQGRPLGAIPIGVAADFKKWRQRAKAMADRVESCFLWRGGGDNYS